MRSVVAVLAVLLPLAAFAGPAAAQSSPSRPGFEITPVIGWLQPSTNLRLVPSADTAANRWSRLAPAPLAGIIADFRLPLQFLSAHLTVMQTLDGSVGLRPLGGPAVPCTALCDQSQDRYQTMGAASLTLASLGLAVRPPGDVAFAPFLQAGAGVGLYRFGRMYADGIPLTDYPTREATPFATLGTGVSARTGDMDVVLEGDAYYSRFPGLGALDTRGLAGQPFAARTQMDYVVSVGLRFHSLPGSTRGKGRGRTTGRF
jgi:hypothetical protein